MKQNSFPLPKSRQEIRSFEPYIPGKSIDEIKKKYNLKSVIKLASNENPLGSSKKIVKNINSIAKNIYRYPESSSLILRKKIAQRYNVKIEQVIIGCGTDELIEIIAKTYLSKEDNIVVSKHAFIRYKMSGELMGCSVIEVPMKNFTHDLYSMSGYVNNRTKIIFIANPNNPTGTYNTHKDILQFLSILFKKNFYPIVVIDEAYYEYAIREKNYADSLKLLKYYPNIIILRTFSKVYGLAGLRVGYGISRKEIISELDRVRPPFNVTSFGQYLASNAFEDTAHIKKSVNLVIREKEFLYQQLEIMGLNYVKTAGNFILVNVTPYRGKQIFLELLKLGIIVRAMDEYELPYHFRVTISTHKENIAFLNSLEKVLKKIQI